MKNRMVEILAPAGSYESLKAAVNAGADAVYIGGSRFGARAYADNLDAEKMLEAIDYVHLHGRKIYLTVNTLLKDQEIDELYDYLLPYYKHGLDAVIVQDTGVFNYIKMHFPELPIHISTQMTVTNEKSACFFKELGAERIVPARELSLEEIRKMKEATGLEIECFVHGALCYCYSGQCLLSSMIGGRSGNRGQCAQPCRLPYSVHDKKSQDILSLKDLCTIEIIPELIEAGIDSFKIEGRMKQPEYVYTVVSMYRKYVDLYLASGKKGFKVQKDDILKLQGIYRRRGYCEGYYKQHNGKNMISLKRPEDDCEVMQIPDFKIQEEIHGELSLVEGKTAKLELYFNGNSVVCEGDVVQSAMKQPLDKDRVEKQMRKTGTTQFKFGSLDIMIKGNIFLPMQSLNELRRNAIDLLEDKILSSFRRNSPENIQKALKSSQYSDTRNRGIIVSVQDEKQLKAALEIDDVTIVYVDGKIARERQCIQLILEKKKNQKIYFTLPHIFRNASMEKYVQFYDVLRDIYDGVLVRNWEGYQWLKSLGYDKPMIADYNLYVFNKWSKNFLYDTSFSGYTAPVELNVKELGRLDISDASLIVYGHQPVMFSAGCVQKNLFKCTHESGILYLKDRYQKEFAVKNYCDCCYNIVYNSAPLVLVNNREEVEELNPKYIRLDFTIEKAEDIKQILEMYVESFVNKKDADLSLIEFTRGHFKRGVK